MAEITWATLQPEVAIHVPEAPGPLIRSKLREAARYFFQESESWRHELDPHTLVAGVSELELDLPPDTMLVKPITLTVSGRVLEPSSEPLLDHKLYGWSRQMGQPRYYIQRHSTLRLVPTPNGTVVQGLTGVVALKPDRGATGLPEQLVDDYYEGIVARAVHGLMIVPGNAWYNPDLAMGHMALYQDRVTQARAQAQNDHIAKVRRAGYGGY